MYLFKQLALVLAILWVIFPPFKVEIPTPCWAQRHPGQGYEEFILAARENIAEQFPEWYQEDTRIGLDLRQKNVGLLGITRENRQGKPVIQLTTASMSFCTVENLGHTLLHEYVHASVWGQLKAEIPSPVCRSIRHELLANAAVIRAYEKLDYDSPYLLLAVILYKKHRNKAVLLCSPEIWLDLPVPLPIP